MSDNKALPLKLKDSDGKLQQITSAEKNYLAYLVGSHNAVADSSDVGLLTKTASGNRLIGTLTDTYFPEPVGTHPYDQQSVVTTSQNIYQINGTAAETDSDFRLPIAHFDGDVYEMNSSNVNTLVDDLNVRIATSDYPGSLRLSTTAPGSGYEILVPNILTDQRADSDGNPFTINTYNIWRRTSMTAPTSIRDDKNGESAIMSIKRSSGASGTYQGLQKITDRQVKVSLGQRAKTRRAIADNVGSYVLRTATQGAPATGTWVARGNAVNTIRLVDEQNYTRTRVSAYSQPYTRNFVDTYSRTRASSFLGNYTGNYVGGNFVGNYTGDFTGNYTGDYTGNYARNFIGEYSSTFSDTYSSVYSRNRASTFSSTYSRNFVGNYQVAFVGNYIGQIEPGVDEDFTRVRGYIGNYANNFTRTSTRTSTREFTRERGSTFSRDFIGNYSRGFAGNYAGNYLGNYTQNFTRGRESAFTRTSTRNRNSGFAREYVGTYTRDVGFTRTSTRTRTSAYEGNYARNFSDDYARNYVGFYARNYTRVRSSNFTRLSTRTRFSTFARGFIGNYTGTSVTFARDRVEQYAGNYSRGFVGEYARTFQGN